PPQDATDVDTLLPMRVGEARSVTDEAPGHDELAPLIDCRDRMTRSQCDDSIRLAVQERVRSNDNRTRAVLDERCKGCIQVVIVASAQNENSLPGRTRDRSCHCPRCPCCRKIRGWRCAPL